MRFLLTRRWLGLLLAVVVVGVACVELSLWQFRRYADRDDSNQIAERNLSGAPVPVSDVLSTTEPPSAAEHWRAVQTTGTYDTDRQLLVLYRTRDGAPGVDVVVPLVTADGPAVLVDRGWFQTDGTSNLTPVVPPPPPGEVAVVGWVRLDAEGNDDQTTPADGSVRAISSEAIGATLPYDLYEGFLDLTGESPAPAESLTLASKPDLGAGPSFFYGIQWLFFGLLAFGFWLYFAWSEYTQHERNSNDVTTRGSTLHRPGASHR